MAQLSVFVFITLDGYYKGLNEDISWHKHGPEESEFSEENLQSGNMLLFGRKTYEMMANFWPTPMAQELYPIVAAGMNKAEKIVFTKTLQKANWQNTRIISENIFDEIRKLKQIPGRNMTILGSGNLIGQLAEEGLIDAYQIMVDPVAIGDGTPLFKNIKSPLNLKLTGTRTFKNGEALLNYIP